MTVALRHIIIVASIAAKCSSSAAEPIDFQTAVSLSRQYLASDDDEERSRLEARLSGYRGEIDPVVAALAARTYPAVKPGYYADEKFESAELRKKYPQDWLYFIVPPTYEPKQPTGLIVFLHGGGLNTSRDAAMYTLDPGESQASSRMLAATGMIIVGPSAPGKGESYYRWCLRASEEYLADVIAECKARFNIDADRVFLLGHSMGGFGAFHHAQRQPDRFAAIVVSSGAWDWGYWPVLRGTPMAIISGVNDAQRGVRWHHTDVEYARQTDRIFQREKLDHKYYEHDGEHCFGENRASVSDYLATAGKLRRDPYYPRIAVATPQGFTYNYMHRVRHNRWLTLDEETPGEIRVDELVTRGSDFDSWRLMPRRTLRRGAAMEAINRGDNRIDVTTENVARFTVWLHPKMVDIDKPVTIHVDDKLAFSARLRPSLVTALQSYQRRNDWGLIYPLKVELRVAGETE